MRLQPSLAAARARGGARAHPRLPPPPSQARTGGKGTVRRKAAAVTKATAADDKRLGAVLKRLQCNVRALPRCAAGGALSAAAAPRRALLKARTPRHPSRALCR